jgi:hypothetical protein
MKREITTKEPNQFHASGEIGVEIGWSGVHRRILMRLVRLLAPSCALCGEMQPKLQDAQIEQRYSSTPSVRATSREG